MYDGEQQNIKEYMDNVLEKKIHIIYIRNDDFSYLYEITNALKNKEIIAIHGDRYLPGSSRITCKFMGEDAQVPTGPFYLAAKYNVPVINVAAVKKKATHYDFFATPPKTYPYPSKLKERKKDLRIMVEDYIAFQEKVLKNNSLQWFNYYQFWN